MKRTKELKGNKKKISRYIPHILAGLTVLFIFLSFFKLHTLLGAENIWYNSTSAFFAFTIFALLAGLLVFAVAKMESQLKYILIPVLFILGIYIELTLLFIHTPLLDYFMLTAGLSKFCSPETLQIFKLDQDQTYVQACMKLNAVIQGKL